MRTKKEGRRFVSSDLVPFRKSTTPTDDGQFRDLEIYEGGRFRWLFWQCSRASGTILRRSGNR
jgi:hypothetical protein